MTSSADSAADRSGELRRRKLAHYFRVHDQDGDGRIGREDFHRVVDNLRDRRGLTDQAAPVRALRDAYDAFWDALRERADTDGDGRVDLDEWLDHWAAILADERRYEREVGAIVTRIFAFFDLDRSAAIEADEFCDFHAAHGLSPAFARQVFVTLDRDGDGAVDWEEFLDTAHGFWRGTDPDAPANDLFGPLDG